jgi:hypothetical protein
MRWISRSTASKAPARAENLAPEREAFGGLSRRPRARGEPAYTPILGPFNCKRRCVHVENFYAGGSSHYRLQIGVNADLSYAPFRQRRERLILT